MAAEQPERIVIFAFTVTGEGDPEPEMRGTMRIRLTDGETVEDVLERKAREYFLRTEKSWRIA